MKKQRGRLESIEALRRKTRIGREERYLKVNDELVRKGQRMPELPDAEVFRRYISSTSLHQNIVDVRVNKERLLENISARGLKSGLAGRSIREAARHGKYVFGILKGGGSLVLHFGMTGGLEYGMDHDPHPEYGRISFRFSNGYRLVYTSMRLLGKVTLTDDIKSYIERKGLGPDALDLPFGNFRKIMNRGRGRIKSTLMNQALIAGIGNVYSDEILYQARIHPEARELGKDETLKLFRSMKKVLLTAIERRADPSEFPRSYITQHRREGEKCPYCSDRVKRKKISGRSSYFCPKCQKKGG